MELTHINEQGRARMVDVSEKDDTKRIAVAFGKICMKKETLVSIQNQEIKSENGMEDLGLVQGKI